jgi:hypothetical protein
MKQGRSIMRPRFTVLALLVSALAFVSVPAVASAHGPRHNHGLTIAATPDPITAGEGVLIYGKLKGPDPAGQTVYLYHRINPAPGFSLISKTTTDKYGFYWFTRAEGVVTSNREWFVTAPGSPGVHSRTVHELVYAEVNLAASTMNGTTNQPVVFSGHVTPNHAGDQIVLQEQGSATGNAWHTLKAGLIGPGSNYSISYRFRLPGGYTLRTLLRRDNRNLASVSTPLTETVQQTEVPDFTINSSSPIITDGQSANITGTLDLAGTTTPEPNVSVTLWGRTAHSASHTVGTPVVTDMNGDYSFTVSPSNNTVYQVRTTFAPPKHRATALLFEGVQDVVMANPIPPTAVVGQHIQFTGSVSPDKAGHVIYLEKLGSDGYWHIAEVSLVHNDSTFAFGWTFGNPGTKEFRVVIPGGPDNIGAASSTATISVTLPPTPASLPQPTSAS